MARTPPPGGEPQEHGELGDSDNEEIRGAPIAAQATAAHVCGGDGAVSLGMAARATLACLVAAYGIPSLAYRWPLPTPTSIGNQGMLLAYLSIGLTTPSPV